MSLINVALMADSLSEEDRQDDFGYYHPEPEEHDPYNFKKGVKTPWVRALGVIRHDVAAIWGWGGDYADWLDYEEEPKKEEEKKCECGSAAIKWPVHSDWCPKYRRPDEEE